MHTYLEWPVPMAFAHRGGASDNPENTIPAFQHAVDLGFSYLETDVHATADGVLLAFHDDRLDRTTDRTGLIRELPWNEIQSARVHGKVPIATFDELIETFPKARFNIDCKHDSAVDALAAAIRRHQLFDRCCIGSFNDLRLRRLRRVLGASLCTSMGSVEVTRWRTTGRGGGADCAQVPTHIKQASIVTEGTVRRSHARGVPVIVWTIDEPDTMHHLLDMGVDGIMTDRPAVLRSVLEERGQWL